MRIRKSVAALSICAASAGLSVLGAGSAFAAEWEKTYGPYQDMKACGTALEQDISKEPNFVGGMCEPRADGAYAVVTFRN